jgi:hypothetical protein
MASRSYPVPFDRELILLPVVNVKETEEHIWEFEGKYYTLATSTMSYLFLQGKERAQEKKICSYTYKY